METDGITQRHHVVPEVRWHPPDGTSHPTAGTHPVKSSTEAFRTLPVQEMTREVATQAQP